MLRKLKVIKRRRPLKLKSVEATFYFKNDKILNISSNSGFYNKKLDMIFENKVEGSTKEAIYMRKRQNILIQKIFLLLLMM